MDWKLKRKNKALRNATIRIKNCSDSTSAALLARRIKEANQYLTKFKQKQQRGWFK